jgi:hypothetical protein
MPSWLTTRKDARVPKIIIETKTVGMISCILETIRTSGGITGPDL